MTTADPWQAATDQMREQPCQPAQVLAAPLWIIQAEADRRGISVQAMCERWGLEFDP